MSSFKDWLYRETLKLSETREMYHSLFDFTDKIYQLGLKYRLEDVDTNLFKTRCAIAYCIARMDEEIKDACMKHLRRNKKRSETNENK